MSNSEHKLVTEAPALYDHHSPINSEYSAGVYRVVGVNEEGVTLLRVANSDGTRLHTGIIISVSECEFNGFAPAENPDGNRSIWDAAVSSGEMLYWSVRVFAQQLAQHRLKTGGALALLATGYFGEGVLPLPNPILTAMILVGSLGLAYIATGRL